jgi:hypothetical protein
MPTFPKFRPDFRQTPTDQTGTSVVMNTLSESEKNPAIISGSDVAANANNRDEEPQAELPVENAQ